MTILHKDSFAKSQFSEKKNQLLGRSAYQRLNHISTVKVSGVLGAPRWAAISRQPPFGGYLATTLSAVGSYEPG